MAGDWIKVRDDLVEDPAVGRMATALGIDKYGVVGRLIRVWIWADRQSPDGNADVTLAYLDELTNTRGMGDAMVLVGWLEVPENGRIVFPKYDRHMSRNAKKRALTSKRVQAHRSNANATPLKRKRNAGSVTREEGFITKKHLPVANSKPTPKPNGHPVSENPKSTPTASSDPVSTPGVGLTDATLEKLPPSIAKAVRHNRATSFEDTP